MSAVGNATLRLPDWRGPNHPRSLSGDPTQQAAATDKAADALAKAQNIPPDQAKAQVEQYQQQCKETVVKAKEQAKQVADTTAKTVSRGALFGALALLLGAPAAFFCGPR